MSEDKNEYSGEEYKEWPFTLCEGIDERLSCLGDVAYWFDDDPMWDFDVCGLDVTVTLVSSETMEGTDEGYNISIVIATREGEIKGQICPHNFTREVWTNEPDELMHRVSLVIHTLEDFVLDRLIKSL